MKKTLSIILSLCMVMSIFSFSSTVFADDEELVCMHLTVHEKVTRKATFKKSGVLKYLCDDCNEVLVTCTIGKLDVYNPNTTYSYDGKSKTPKPEVSHYIESDADYREYSLKNKKDFTVKYDSNTSGVGTHKMKVTVNTKYAEGTKELSYKILPKVDDSVAVQKGKKATLKVKSNKKCTFKSSNTGVATVNSKGVITGKKSGKCTVTVTSNKVSKKVSIEVRDCGLYVNYCPVSNAWVHQKGNNEFIDMGGSKVSNTKTHYDVYNAGDKINLSKSVTAVPSSAKISWKSSNTAVATVNSKGVVTTKKKGDTTITASMTYNGKTYKKTICVVVDCHVNGC